MKNIFLLSVLLLLTACATTPTQEGSKTAFIAPHIKMVFPALKDFRSNMNSTQLITASYDKRSYTLQNQVSITPDNLLIVFYDPLGRKALSITWSGNVINYDVSQSTPSGLPPENVLADFIFLNWPEKSIRTALKNSGAIFKITKHSRAVYKDGKLLLEAEYQSPGIVTYRNYGWNYTLDIQSANQ